MSTAISQYFTWPLSTELAPEELAQDAIRQMPMTARTSVLLQLLTEWVAGIQRMEVRRIERRASDDPEERRRHRRWRAEMDEKRRTDPEHYGIRGLMTALEEFRQEVRLELTAELLDSHFALGNGRVVTWGTATEEDHQQRAKLLEQNALGNLQTMILHEKAIEMIRASGVRTLGDVQAVAA